MAKLTSNNLRRTGFISVFLLIALPIFLLFLALVINWSYLVHVHQNMQSQTDLLALNSSYALLDERILQDRWPSDKKTILAHVKKRLKKSVQDNDSLIADPLKIHPENLKATVGYIQNSHRPITDQKFYPHNKRGKVNAVKIVSQRKSNGKNPVRLLAQFYHSPEKIDVESASFVCLANRLLGFKPTNQTSTPILPIAINQNDWFVHRVKKNQDYFPRKWGNGRKEITIRIDTKNAKFPNGAQGILVSLDGTRHIAPHKLLAQTIHGIFAKDLYNRPMIGPATYHHPWKVQASHQHYKQLLWNLNRILNHHIQTSPKKNLKKIIPLYSVYSKKHQSALLTGFISARIIHSQLIVTKTECYLAITLEPEFMLHPTVVTDPRAPENLYIHKPMLIR